PLRKRVDRAARSAGGHGGTGTIARWRAQRPVAAQQRHARITWPPLACGRQPHARRRPMSTTRHATAHWSGDLKTGGGTISTPQSGLMADTAYGFNTRFGDKKGTNPEELIAAAHAACFT